MKEKLQNFHRSYRGRFVNLKFHFFHFFFVHRLQELTTLLIEPVTECYEK